MNSPLVVFGEDWGAHPSSTQHLVRWLLKDRAVCWINSIGLRRPRPTGHDLRRGIAKLLAAAGGLIRWDERAGDRNVPLAAPTMVVTPLAVPLPGHPVARALNRRLLARALRMPSRLGIASVPYCGSRSRQPLTRWEQLASTPGLLLRRRFRGARRG